VAQFTRQRLVHDAADDGDAHESADLSEVAHCAGSDAQVRRRHGILSDDRDRWEEDAHSQTDDGSATRDEREAGRLR
jgi:hypothetical protein